MLPPPGDLRVVVLLVDHGNHGPCVAAQIVVGALETWRAVIKQAEMGTVGLFSTPSSFKRVLPDFLGGAMAAVYCTTGFVVKGV